MDANPGDGVCADAGGNCTLRAAIQEANALAGIDTVIVPTGSYTLTITGTGEDAAATGDLDITDDLTITGAGAAATIIDGGALDRVFHVGPSASGITVEMSGVTVRNGATPTWEDGGGILNLATLTLTDSSVSENAVALRSGGGISNSGTLTLINSSVSQNSAAGSGGGIANSGTLQLTNTIVSDNTGGGGISNNGTATLTDSTVSGNSTGSQGGGGIRNYGPLTLNTCTITGNSSAGNGGGISHGGFDTLTIIDSTISGNTSHNYGGGIDNSSATANIVNSTISSNTNGGIRNRSAAAVLTLTNCTVSSNNSRLDGGGIRNDNGATTNLNNVTIVNNVANSGQQTGSGGGVANLKGTVNLSNTIIANNSDYHGNRDCAGILTSTGHNLIRTLSGGCTIAGDTTGNITGQHPRLGPLQDNGGPTATHAPGTVSPARDNGNPAAPGSGGNACESTDQRGVARPLDGDGNGLAHCDMGAHESTHLVFTYTVNSADDADDGVCDVGHCSLREAINASNATSTGIDTIAFDIPGDGPHTIQPTTALPNVTDPVVIDGYTQPGASPNTSGPGLGSDAVLLIELDGSAAPAGTNGLQITMGETTIRGLVVNRFLRSGTTGGRGIELSSLGNNVIAGNFIGTDTTGTLDYGNAFHGVSVAWTHYNTIGGTTPAARNVISGNDYSGIGILGTGNQVLGNFIGTNASGTAIIPNAREGVEIGWGTANIVGGIASGAGNVISGNATNGVLLLGLTYDSVVQGNLIGTDVTGTAGLGNGYGVRVQQGATRTTIGGTTEAERNVISANWGGGVILVQGPETVVKGNFIGTAADGVSPLGNWKYGVLVAGPDHLIGGTEPGAGNVIAFNGGAQFPAWYGPGVRVTSTGASLISNAIFSNLKLGINLDYDEVTPNDPGDADTGPNNLQNFPDLTTATSAGGITVITGTLDSLPNASYTLQFFGNTACDPSGYGEGERYLGSTTVDIGAVGPKPFTTTVDIEVPVGEYLTATATDSSGNTSEFSLCAPVLDGDCNGNGVHDSIDIAGGASQDCNGNGIPDDCDVDPADPDGNGAVSIDCDGNGTPDECEADCNGNGIADACDIDPADPDGNGEVSADCNSDGTPDECEADSDGDGVIDGCDICPGFDDHADADGDAVPEGCDPCPSDNPDDTDGDGVCDSSDICPGGDDNVDTDGDGVPDFCDPCPSDNPDDTDGDGVCDSSDVCPGGDDNIDGDGDCTEASQEDCTALSSSANIGPTTFSGIDTTCSTTDCAPAAPTKWVLSETLVNPDGADSDHSWVGFQDEQQITYTTTATSVTYTDWWVDNLVEQYNVTVTSNFPTPAAELNPGDTVVLSVSFTHSGTVLNGNPGAQFQYWVDGHSINPQFSYFYLPWSPDFSGETSTTYSFVVPNVSANGTLTIAAFWWNCGECDVSWVYGPG